MTGRSRQGGAALILLLGITATLALFVSTLVFVISNQQRATAHVRSSKQSLYAAEAALDSGVRLAKVNHMMSTTSPWLTPEELQAAFATAGFPAGADVTFRVYDDLADVNYDIQWDQGGPTQPNTPDNMVWVEATVTYEGQTTRSRVLVSQTRKPFAEALPKAVTYSDTGIRLNGSSDIYAVNADGTPDTSGPPYDTSITAGGTWLPSMPSSWAEVGRFTMNSSSDLAAPGTTTQSLGITANGSVSVGGTVFNSAPSGTISAAGHTFDDVVIQPGVVGFLSDYFDQAAQTSLASESQAASPARANASPPYTAASTQFTPNNLTTAYLASINASFDSGTKTYTFNSDLAVTGDLTLRTSGNPRSGRFPSGTTFKFRSLYLNGSLAVTGDLTLDTTALYVGTNFTISGATDASIKDWLGSVYVRAVPSAGTGDVNWSGAASVTSRDYTNPMADPQPLWLGDYFSRTGTYNDDYGPIWVPGNSTTSVVFGSTGSSTVMCPLLCTTEKTTVSGHIDFGTRANPMVYFFMCDNNGIYPQVVDWAGTGTFYGLMVINESTIDFTNGSTGTPSVDGAVFAGCPYDPTYTSGLSKSDIVLNGNCSIAYDKSVVGAIATSSLKTTVLVTQTVPGSWQQLPVEN
jgi:hypothetical protein